MSRYDNGLDGCNANHQPMTPAALRERAARTHPDHWAVIHGKQRATYAGL